MQNRVKNLQEMIDNGGLETAIAGNSRKSGGFH